MHFINPLQLLWALPIGGVIIVMYILKLRRKDVIVSSTFLWRQVIRDVQANAPFQKLRRNLLLLLQLIIAAFLIFALSRPFFKFLSLGGRNMVIIVDTSASMGATDETPTRLDKAKQKAHQLVRERKPGDLVMVLSASSRPRAVTGFSKDGSELDRAIDGLTLQETPTNMRDALNLAADLVASRNNGENGDLELISDGGFESQGVGSGADGALQYTLANLNLGKTHVAFHPIGKRQNNVGITAVDFRRNLGAEKTDQLLVVTHNYSNETKKFNEEIYAEENLVEAHEITLKPNEEDTQPYDIPEPDKPTRMKVKLDVKDDLAADNQAALILKPRKTLKTLLIGNENPFLESALKVDPSIELSKAASYTGTKGYDVVIFNETAPAKLPEGNYLFLHCTSDQSPVKVEGSAENVAAADTDKDHPVMRYFDLTQERFGSALKASTLGWGKEIAVGDSGSMVVAGEKNKMRAVFVGFTLHESLFPLRIGFPIFIANAVRWLGTGNDDSESGQAKTGEAITIPVPPGIDKITVTKPDGSKLELRVGERGGVVFDDVNQAGIYSAEGKGFNYPFAANLSSASESDTTPHNKLTIADNPLATTGRRVADNVELLPLLALIALGVLAFEWWAFHRRTHLG